MENYKYLTIETKSMGLIKLLHRYKSFYVL